MLVWVSWWRTRHSVPPLLAKQGPLPTAHTAGAGPGRGTTQDTQHEVSVSWDKVCPSQKVQEYLLERKYSTSGNGTGSGQIFFKGRVVTFLAMSESLKHFLSINRGVTVEHSNYNRALFVTVWGCFLSKYNESAPSKSICRAKLQLRTELLA